LSAHLIIPHDHHCADSYTDHDEDCPVSNKDSGHHSGFPIHCHAFNDLTSERSRPFQISENNQYRFVSFSLPTDAQSVDLPNSYVSIREFSKPVFDSKILKCSSLRAPPALS